MENRSKLVGEKSSSIPKTKSGTPAVWKRKPFFDAYSLGSMVMSVSAGSASGEGTEVAYWITAIDDRRNYIVRKSTNLSKQSHIIAANVDQACLVVTISHPETSTTFIDRFLASAEAYRVPVILVFMFVSNLCHVTAQ